MRSHCSRSFTPALAFASLVCTTASPAADAPASVEDRLRQLEQTVQTLARENGELKKQLGWDGKKSLNLVEDNGKAATVGIGGYLQVQAGFGGSPDPRFTVNNANDSFSVRRARVNVFGKFLEHFDYKIETDLGGLGSGLRAQLTDGYINWNRYDFANIKAGQYKTHFGAEQLVGDTATLVIERAYTSDRLTAGRQIGASVTGTTLEKRLSYAAGIFNGNSVNNGFNDGDDFTGTARLEGIPVKTKLGSQDLTWTLGINGLLSDDSSVTIPSFGLPGNTFTGYRRGVGADTQLALGPVGLQAECITMQYDTASAAQPDFAATGFFLTATCDIVAKKLQAVARWESMETEDDIGGNDCDVLTLGLNYCLKGSNLKLMANYLYGKIEGDDWESRFLARLQVAY